MMLVVSIHELGHAFTLKHYGGIVPEIGLLFMCFMPGCYTDTTDSYCLVKRRQRTLVVAAGVLCQLIIWAIALWLWNLSNPDTWLHTTSYLLMVAALFTVALNLNPMSKFDGYYLAVAITGINNLRSRSFQFYSNLFRLKLSPEQISDRLILAAYAPFSFFYILFVFGHLWFGIGDWLLSNIPMTALIIILLWAIYFFYPHSSKQAH
jgi:putative peptide zinc metalloprotease protein